MNKRGQSEIGWLIILLITFIIMNIVSIWIHGEPLEAIKTWIFLIIEALIEALIIWGLFQLRSQ